MSTKIIAGVDLAWRSDRNGSAIAVGELTSTKLKVLDIYPTVFGTAQVLETLLGTDGLSGVAIDAPLIIKNETGQRPCETAIGRAYGAKGASCHTSNTKLYPDAGSVFLAQQLETQRYRHLGSDRWQIECYPHPSIIEIFGLARRLKYKKGTAAERKDGQKTLASLLNDLNNNKTLSFEIEESLFRYLNEDRIDSLSGKSLKTNEDALDSLICLYIAGLYANRCRGKVFGNVDSGYIWVPHTTDP